MPGPTAYERRDLMHRFIHLFIFTYARTATVVEMPLFVFIKALGAARSMWGTVYVCVYMYVCVHVHGCVCMGEQRMRNFMVFFYASQLCATCVTIQSLPGTHQPHPQCIPNCMGSRPYENTGILQGMRQTELQKKTELDLNSYSTEFYQGATGVYLVSTHFFALM